MAAMELLGRADARFDADGTRRQPGEEAAIAPVQAGAARSLGQAIAEAARLRGRNAGGSDQALYDLGSAQTDPAATGGAEQARADTPPRRWRA
jgi:hypothetical protein